jgi:hypothetical protein
LFEQLVNVKEKLSKNIKINEKLNDFIFIPLPHLTLNVIIRE